MVQDGKNGVNGKLYFSPVLQVDNVAAIDVLTTSETGSSIGDSNFDVNKEDIFN